MGKTANALKKYLKERGESILAFCNRARIPPSTIYRIIDEERITKKLAIKICRNSKGELTLKDFNYD